MGDLAKKTIEVLRNLGMENAVKVDRTTFLSTPISDLKKPLAVDSKILGEAIYLVADEGMAKEVEVQGKVAYLPEEISALSRQSKTMEWGDWIAFLKNLHMAKKTFLASRIQA